MRWEEASGTGTPPAKAIKGIKTKKDLSRFSWLFFGLLHSALGIFLMVLELAVTRAFLSHLTA